MEKPPRYTDVQFCNRAILGGWNEEKIEDAYFLREKKCKKVRFCRILAGK